MDSQLLRLLFDLGLVVLIWMVQLIIYPSFKRYSKDNLEQWHKIYVQRIAIIVVPLMLGQLIISIYQLYKVHSAYTIGSLLAIIFLWGFTFTHFAPIHRQISNNLYSPDLLYTLQKRNWLRTLLWTLIFLWGITQSYIYPTE